MDKNLIEQKKQESNLIEHSQWEIVFFYLTCYNAENVLINKLKVYIFLYSNILLMTSMLILCSLKLGFKKLISLLTFDVLPNTMNLVFKKFILYSK